MPVPIAPSAGSWLSSGGSFIREPPSSLTTSELFAIAMSVGRPIIWQPVLLPLGSVNVGRIVRLVGTARAPTCRGAARRALTPRGPSGPAAPTRAWEAGPGGTGQDVRDRAGGRDFRCIGRATVVGLSPPGRVT